MPREGDRHDRGRAKKKQESTKLKEDKKLCETEGCFQIIWSGEQYCDPCKLNRFPEKYAKSCRAGACGKKTLDEYCDQHNKTCVSCDSRNLVGNSKYCAQHAGTCATCSTRTPRGQIYCETHQKEESLKRSIGEKFSLYDHKEVVQFNTGGNKNLVTLINGNNPYALGVLVYEPAIRNKAEILQKFEINFGYDRYSLSSTQNKASSIRSELNGENPILAIHPSANSHVSFSEIVKSPYVKTIEVPCEYEDKIRMVPFPNRSTCRHAASSYVPVNIKEKIPNKNPENYLKPLDVVGVKKIFMVVHFYHVGIYLGNGEVCHIAGGKDDGRGIRNCSGETFVKGCVDGEVFSYHSIIPFKNYETITRQISWVINNQGRENDYCLAGQNCEHATNMIAYGIEWSKQVAEKPNLAEFAGRKYAANKSKSGLFILKDEIKRANSRLGELDNQKAKEIKDKYEARIEVSGDGL